MTSAGWVCYPERLELELRRPHGVLVTAVSGVDPCTCGSVNWETTSWDINSQNCPPWRLCSVANRNRKGWADGFNYGLLGGILESMIRFCKAERKIQVCQSEIKTEKSSHNIRESFLGLFMSIGLRVTLCLIEINMRMPKTKLVRNSTVDVENLSESTNVNSVAWCARAFSWWDEQQREYYNWMNISQN